MEDVFKQDYIVAEAITVERVLPTVAVRN